MSTIKSNEFNQCDQNSSSETYTANFIKMPNSCVGMDKFYILDETDEDSETEHSSKYDSDDITDDEVGQAHDDAFAKRKRSASEFGLDDASDKIHYDEKVKVVLLEKGRNLLPEGWVQVIHDSGIPLYLHKVSKVCTMSPPYFLGPGSARKHQIPVNAIPCLSYKEALEKDKETNNSEIPANSPNEQNSTNARTGTFQQNAQTKNLSPEEVRSYCENLFQFKSINCLRFQSWQDRKKFNKRRKVEWAETLKGKSYVTVLNELVQSVLKSPPMYQFATVDSNFSATVKIREKLYGTGYGRNKKEAKSNAAKATLKIFAPDIESRITIKSEGKNLSILFFQISNSAGVQSKHVGRFLLWLIDNDKYSLHIAR